MSRWLIVSVLVLVSCRDARQSETQPRSSGAGGFAGQWVFGDRLFPDDSIHLTLEEVGADSLRGVFRFHAGPQEASGKIDGGRARIDIGPVIFMARVPRDTLELKGVGSTPDVTLWRYPGR